MSASEPNPISLSSTARGARNDLRLGAGTQQNTGQATLALAAGDVVTVSTIPPRLHIGLAALIGGTQATANAAVTIRSSRSRHAAESSFHTPRARYVRFVTFRCARDHGPDRGRDRHRACANRRLPRPPTSEIVLLTQAARLLSRQGKRLRELGSDHLRRPITGVRTASPASAEP